MQPGSIGTPSAAGSKSQRLATAVTVAVLASLVAPALPSPDASLAQAAPLVPIHDGPGAHAPTCALMTAAPAGAAVCVATPHGQRVARRIRGAASFAWRAITRRRVTALAPARQVSQRRTGRSTASPSPSPSVWRSICQWCFTGRAAYWMGVRAGAYPGGWCTWYAWYRAPALTGLGNAWQWAANARARGLPVSSVPQVGATAVFQPGVQGAGGGGHVAHVEAVLGGGWLLVSEMNFAWNGGGFGLVDYRYVHTGPGVLFIL